MKPALQPPGARALALLLAAALCVFAAVACDLVFGGPLTRADAAVSQWLQRQARPWLTTGLLALTHVHGTVGMCVLAGLAAAWLAWRRQPAWALRFGLGVPLAMLLNNIAVKPLFARPRPQLEAAQLSLQTWSFPSGHALAATVFYGLLCALVIERLAPPAAGRAGLGVAALAIVALVGLSRIYLGVHHLTDVVAAMAEGLALVTVLLLARPPAARTTTGSSG